MAQTAQVDPQARNSDSEWFEEGVISLLPDLLSGARMMTGTRADAEDLVADAVARAWERRESLSARDKFRGWIFRIMRNCCISRYRKRKARPEEVPLCGDGDEEPGFSLFERLHQPFLLWWGNPERDFLNGLLKEDIERGVEALPPGFRDAVVLVDVQGLTYAETAEALDIPIGTVRSRLARARACLQKNLWTHAVDRGIRDPDPEQNQ